MSLYNQVNEYGKANGIEFKIISPGVIEYTMTIKKEHLSQPFAAHGGAIAGFMDALLGVCSLSLSSETEHLVSTVEFKINYLNPAIEGDKLLGSASVLKDGKRLIISQGEIKSFDRNIIIASGIGTFNKYKITKSALNNML